MDKHDVAFATPRGIKRPAGALGEHFHINAGLLLERFETDTRTGPNPCGDVVEATTTNLSSAVAWVAKVATGAARKSLRGSVSREERTWFYRGFGKEIPPTASIPG
jgi:hypothetical protein